MQNFQDHVPNKRVVGDQSVHKPIAGRSQDMIPNNTGGYVFETSELHQVLRFLILGTSGGTYYVKEKQLTKDNADALDRALKVNPIGTINLIVEVSDQGRCIKNETCVFALAYAGSNEVLSTRKYALSKLKEVCRIGTDLFAFVEYSKYFRGRGRLFNDALKNWYLDRYASDLAYQLVKYQQRNGWSHRDVLRLCKPNPAIIKEQAFPWASDSEVISQAFQWAVGKCKDQGPLELKAIRGFELAKTCRTVGAIKGTIEEFRLTREMIPTEWLKNPDVWASLIKNTPYGAMIRNLGVLSANGYLKPLSDNVDYIVGRILDDNEIKKSRIHPMKLITAYFTYKAGCGTKGSLTWTPDQRVVKALSDAFYKSFQYVEPTGKKYLLAIDVSASMTWNNIGGLAGFNPRVASAVMALVTMQIEPKCHVVGFCDYIKPLDINVGMSIDSVCRVINNTTMGGTRMDLAIQYATAHRLDVDVFVMYTDNEVNQGSHPSTKLKDYRKEMNKPDAKLAVVAMEANNCSIADPKDAGMMDFVGFDSNTPAAINGFVLS